MAAHHSVIHSQKEFANPETGARVNTAEPVKREDFHEAYDQGGCLLNDSPNRTLNHAQRRSASSRLADYWNCLVRPGFDGILYQVEK